MPEASEILLEFRQMGRSPWAIRFYTNGLVTEYSDQYMAFEGGKIVTHRQPLAWRDTSRLLPAELEKLQGILREVNFFALPDQVGDPQRIQDGTPLAWTVNLDGRSKTVQAVGPEASSDPALKRINEAIQTLTADAFDREGGA
jgi:hypothetical protein